MAGDTPDLIPDILAALTPAQREALLWLSGDGRDAPAYEAPSATALISLERVFFVPDLQATLVTATHLGIRLTPLGRRVRDALPHKPTVADRLGTSPERVHADDSKALPPRRRVREEIERGG